MDRYLEDMFVMLVIKTILCLAVLCFFIPIAHVWKLAEVFGVILIGCYIFRSIFYY